MGRRKKEKKINPNALYRMKPCTDLPKEIDILIKYPYQYKLRDSTIKYGSVSKTWKLPRKCSPAKQSPLLVLSNYANTTTYHSFSERWCSWWSEFGTWDSDSDGNYLNNYVGSPHGKLIMRGGKSPCEYLLLIDFEFNHNQAFRSIGLSFPWRSSAGFCFKKVSTDTTTNCFSMVLTSGSHPNFIFYKLRDGKWIGEECTLFDPNSSEPCTIQFTNTIVFEGKFYLLSLQGTLAVIDANSNPRVKILGSTRAIPSTCSKGFREILIESGGEILLVFLISRKSTNIVDDVEVFKLDLAKPSWIKMENLGGRTLFVGFTCCISVSASELGCRGNCIYFIQRGLPGWWVFHMETGGISPAGWNADSDSN
ncbi:PREDICTED: uncharacterized protein LOC104603941 [Nelumbo nucifera]|uniref:Uncharacterized protein LOC104603941 n=1 Tax=Nelumbo nucifera TaxID=4432 RepID=A0A1U8ATH1_NELNU|nr:PREDICTED: uncharacterized protein LOC104603941 [Nelumbo nucifera]